MGLKEIEREVVDWISLAQDRVQHSTEFSGSMKRGEFLYQLSDCQLFKMDSTPKGVSRLVPVYVESMVESERDRCMGWCTDSRDFLSFLECLYTRLVPTIKIV
jgi:hypothetical protein